MIIQPSNSLKRVLFNLLCNHFNLFSYMNNTYKLMEYLSHYKLGASIAYIS